MNVHYANKPLDLYYFFLSCAIILKEYHSTLTLENAKKLFLFELIIKNITVATDYATTNQVTQKHKCLQV